MKGLIPTTCTSVETVAFTKMRALSPGRISGASVIFFFESAERFFESAERFIAWIFPLESAERFFAAPGQQPVAHHIDLDLVLADR